MADIIPTEHIANKKNIQALQIVNTQHHLSTTIN